MSVAYYSLPPLSATKTRPLVLPTVTASSHQAAGLHYSMISDPTTRSGGATSSSRGPTSVPIFALSSVPPSLPSYAHKAPLVGVRTIDVPPPATSMLLPGRYGGRLQVEVAQSESSQAASFSSAEGAATSEVGMAPFTSFAGTFTGGSFSRMASRVLAQVGSTGAPRTFRCPVCMENVREQDRFVMECCGQAEHGCCLECSSTYVKGLIQDGRVTHVPCLVGGTSCGSGASEEEVRQLTDDPTYEKFERFRRMQQDRRLRECPGCKVLCHPDEGEDHEIVPQMVCKACHTPFCYYHSNAHPDRPCEEYRREMAREERLLIEGINGVKPCPNPDCGINTEKLSGCNHMTCGSCKIDWCWTCGLAIANVAWHYNPGNPNGCQQFQDSEHVANSRLLRCLRVSMLPVVLVSLLIFFASSLTAIVWAPVVSILIGPCVRCDCNIIGMVVAVFTYLPFIVFQVFWLAPALLLNTLLCPCGSSTDTLYFLTSVPFSSVMSLLEGGAAH